jgi:hypothetical protein
MSSPAVLLLFSNPTAKKHPRRIESQNKIYTQKNML